MPAGFGVGDHRMFVVDFRLQSLVSASPPKVVRIAARRLNTTIPYVAERYVQKLEELFLSHRLNSRLVDVEANSQSKDLVRWKANKIDQESNQYMSTVKKKGRRIKNGRIPFSPESSIWIRRGQVYESLLRRLQQKIRNWSNLRQTAQRCGISRPFQLSKMEIQQRLQVCEERCQFLQMANGTGANIYSGGLQRQRLRKTKKPRNKF